MSTITSPSTLTSTSTVAERLPIWKHGVAAAVGASIVTTALAAAASTAGVSFAGPSGDAIPLVAFAQLTLLFSLIGVGLAAVLARRANRPRSTFLRTTLLLTVLSVVPDATFGFDPASAFTLMGLHVVAAAIVIPVLTGRLAPTR